MKRIRKRVIFLVSWLVGLCSLDKLLEPIEISSVAYLVMLGMTAFALLFPRLARFHMAALLVVPLPLFFTLRLWIHPPEGSAAILQIIVEALGVMLTTFLACRVSQTIGEFELAVAHLSSRQNEGVTKDSSLGAGSLYREVRRSRNHQRPLALLAVALDETSLKANVDRIVQEAQQAMVKQYALSAVARLLCERLEDCDTIVQNNEHFLVLLPETTPEDLPGLIERLRRQTADQVGVELKIGAASLPQDGYTLEGLIDQATRGIKTDQAPEFFLELKRVSTDHQAHRPV
jgi:GGDEF domain-containing protein